VLAEFDGLSPGATPISTGFSTGVENFGERPNTHEFRTSGKMAKLVKEADFNTNQIALTLSPAVRYH
jgi:hypothetical protein